MYRTSLYWNTLNTSNVSNVLYMKQDTCKIQSTSSNDKYNDNLFFSCCFYKLGYTQSILNHRIEYIIKNVIPKWKQDLPECIIQNDCEDCKEWVYV